MLSHLGLELRWLGLLFIQERLRTVFEDVGGAKGIVGVVMIILVNSSIRWVVRFLLPLLLLWSLDETTTYGRRVDPLRLPLFKNRLVKGLIRDFLEP